MIDGESKHHYIPFSGWTVLTEINWTISDGAGNVIGDPHRQIVPVDETDVVPVQSVGSTECPFRYRRRGHTRSSTGVAAQSTVATYGRR